MQQHFTPLRLVAAAFLLTMAPNLCFAYIDPGSGAYVVQALFTMVAAGMFYLKHPLRTLRALKAWLFSFLRREISKVPLDEPHAQANDVVSAQRSRKSD